MGRQNSFVNGFMLSRELLWGIGLELLFADLLDGDVLSLAS
jgi:hypothetical protein